MKDPQPVDVPRVPLWALRVVWLLQPVAFVPLLSAATSTNTTVGRAIVAIVAWSAWAAVLLATFVPSSVSLTTGRLLAPTGVVAAIVAGVSGSSVAGVRTIGAIAASTLAVLLWYSADVAIGCAQGSAYGGESRFPLRMPVPSVPPMVVTWLVLAAAAVGGVALLANERWLVGGVLAATAGVGGWYTGPRFHVMSRRWLVFVPAGVVIHDPLLLVENALFRTPTVAAMHLAPAATEAADLTGGTPGVAIEIVLNDADTVVRRTSPDQPRGAAIHVLSVLVAPGRPGRALSAATAGRLPVR